MSDEINELVLKSKMDQTTDVLERQKLRRQLRELRNKRFEEELAKIGEGGKSPPALGNSLQSTTTLLSEINTRTAESASKTVADVGDPYGLMVYTTEKSLQCLLNDTPFAETDKRRKIRARMRDIRNADIDRNLSFKATSAVAIATSSVGKSGRQGVMDTSPLPSQQQKKQQLQQQQQRQQQQQQQQQQQEQQQQQQPHQQQQRVQQMKESSHWSKENNRIKDKAMAELPQPRPKQPTLQPEAPSELTPESLSRASSRPKEPPMIAPKPKRVTKNSKGHDTAKLVAIELVDKSDQSVDSTNVSEAFSEIDNQPIPSTNSIIESKTYSANSANEVATQSESPNEFTKKIPPSVKKKTRSFKALGVKHPQIFSLTEEDELLLKRPPTPKKVEVFSSNERQVENRLYVRNPESDDEGDVDGYVRNKAVARDERAARKKTEE